VALSAMRPDVTVAISRWVFRIDEIVKNLKRIVSLLEALDKKTN
jgi:hypothetical protein